jgi:hypothetical protein
MFVLSKFKPSPSMVLRPFLMIRVVSDKDLQESQSASGMYGLHNPEAGLPCVSCKVFKEFGELAEALDRKIKQDGEALLECSYCKAVHVLTTKGQPEGWATLARPL